MRDAALALRNLEWQVELGDQLPEIVLSYDAGVSDSWLTNIKTVASRIYTNVRTFRYSNPPAGYWPPNWAFKHAAEYMARGNDAWLWLEPDCVPLCSGWLETISDAYHAKGMPFAAPLIPMLGHYNGTGIYPPATPTIIKHGISDQHTAWDVASRSEMEGKTFDCSHLLFHVWTINNGKPHPFEGGQEPTFTNRRELNIIPATAVLFHRCKDGTLISRLRECKRIL